jgi:WS/DGAT/MGAT family acyltransferase
MHHSLVDGAGGSSFMAALHDLVADPDHDDEPDTEPRLVDTDPSVAELLTKTSINRVKNAVRMARGTVITTRDLGKYALDIMRDEIPAPDVSAPKTVLNKSVGPHRVFDAVEFPLAGFKDIKNAAGVTINDVALGVIGGALQRYLEAKGEAPEEGSLAAALPLNMRTRRGVTEDNNQVGSVFASLHTDISDPLERLAAVNQSTDEAKRSGEASPMVDAMMLAGILSPAITKFAAGFWARNELSRFIPMNVSTCISNVAGPDFPLYCAGAKMVDYYGLGVLTPGMGIFHLVFSYSGKLTLSVLADRAIMPDPEFYHDCMEASYDELYGAVVPQARGGKSKAGVTKAKGKSPKRKAPAKKKAKAAAKSRAPAKRKTPAKAKAKAAAKRKAPAKAKVAKARPKATRRAAGKAKPKLKA